MLTTMESAACGECGASNLALASCSDCMRQFCRCCVSAAGQCRKCAQSVESSDKLCPTCPLMNETTHLCIACGRKVCRQCVRTVYTHRPHFVICTSCQAPAEVMNACSRCDGIITNVNDAHYCEICADTLCSHCLPLSFECGVVKCFACCPSPVRLLKNRCVRTQLTDQLKVIIASVAGQRKSKYSTLYDHVKLGEGGQGVVYKCRAKDGEVVVLKEMRFAECNRPVYEARLRQAATMQKLSHRHVIEYLDVMGSENPLKISVVMRYYSEGDLSKFIRRQEAPVSEEKLCSIALQIAKALKYLHNQSPPIAHCDIKPENVLLLNNEEQVLLMDLDLCHACGGDNAEESDLLFFGQASPTFEYRAPEMADSSGSPKSDIFSFGVLIFVLATLPEFATLRNEKGVQSVLSDSDWTKSSLEKAVSTAIRRRPRKYKDELVNLIVAMLRHDPRERPTAAEVEARLSDIMLSLLLKKK
ncbi:protein kinase, putative [Trypanosoma brucei gambiense DAL972]|uniref:Protein kinase, putative n=2 Tax=Trypanosoma brucei TaxID=5691 RepID=C9ZKZ8_TRYB9|nr:protein kinase, putative [Trypanosoma brucei gambiense DAL972]RHW73886.1 protein kinase [Trypanosoma brucei equiperdum]CBH10006.1 protein kinase, putative [Trypanosoma brucei gambiense DAL972]|eukprot:XP_011772297.1 protein kinase, putative [Trypanosoma brucei gambiense DAL972]